jgi:hypothetical protein
MERNITASAGNQTPVVKPTGSSTVRGGLRMGELSVSPELYNEKYEYITHFVTRD